MYTIDRMRSVFLNFLKQFFAYMIERMRIAYFTKSTTLNLTRLNTCAFIFLNK
ncbi:hypothetical protein QKQ66_gp022 [Dione juno nucleopolyhedrovirus]|uniref:Uncharacterized protein n=1 Tax=Dione juno nucleopolyhedrovirus TaxID=2594175 RepID=A0AAE6LCG5_9ABAC|nr:hypothetical protein QKQ66_gp022 [Dione juno nucleopolyhedrovirus]QDL56939.1 hypothetical protein DijuNPV-ORF-22 [Dione juno nucleopolyhedrovirus]